MSSDSLRVADLAALCQLTDLACKDLALPDVGSDVCLPELLSLTCFHLRATSATPRAVAVTLPQLERLDLRGGETVGLDGLDVECSPDIWPDGQPLHRMVALVHVDLFALPLAMVRTCASVKELYMSIPAGIRVQRVGDFAESTSHPLVLCLPCLCVLKPQLQILKIRAMLGLDEFLSDVFSACPHLAEVCIDVTSLYSGLLTDVGLKALAQLCKLKRVEVRGSNDVTLAGVAALAMNATVDTIHVVDCALFLRPDAQSVINKVQRPYLDIKVTTTVYGQHGTVWG